MCHTRLWLCSLLIVTLLWVVAVSCSNPLERLIAHAHVRGGKLHGCPDSMCEMEPSTKLYFWILKNELAPNMFLQTHTSGQTIQITTTPVAEPKKTPPLTTRLRHELMFLAGGRPMQMVEAVFPNDRMADVTYTFLMTDDYRSWMAADMTCERHKRFMERFRKGQRLVCHLDRRKWSMAE